VDLAQPRGSIVDVVVDADADADAVECSHDPVKRAAVAAVAFDSVGVSDSAHVNDHVHDHATRKVLWRRQLVFFGA
jgi:hypothetical protein